MLLRGGNNLITKVHDTTDISLHTSAAHLNAKQVTFTCWTPYNASVFSQCLKLLACCLTTAELAPTASIMPSEKAFTTLSFEPASQSQPEGQTGARCMKLWSLDDVASQDTSYRPGVGFDCKPHCAWLSVNSCQIKDSCMSTLVGCGHITPVDAATCTNF